MNTLTATASILGLLLLSASGSAEADEMLPITIVNNNTNDVIVTVRDLNTLAHTKVLVGQRINGFAAIPVSITAGADGTGHVRWTATTAGDIPKCGVKERAGLGGNDSVHVYAKSACPVRAPR
jgi:hypothetical protein